MFLLPSLVSMRSLLVRALASAFALSVFSSLAAAQRPTPEQARALLQSRPDLVTQLRQRVATSGLTAEQIRERLRAEGYPPDLLDAYLPGAAAIDSVASPSGNVYSAVLSLGLADSSDVARLWRADSTPGLLPDALGRDSLRLSSLDSLRDSLRDELRSRPLGLPRGVSGAAINPDSGYYIFGLDIFGRRSTQFDPNLAGPIDENYRLGPGDRLVLVLTGDVEAAYTLDVTREGFVVIPRVGQLEVANLTMRQLEDLLYTRLGVAYSGVRRGPGARTRFSISPARLRSNQVYVLGDVQRPGSYRISGAGTVLSALYAAGGPTEAGSLRGVIVRRGRQLADSLDVYDYLLRGDATRDARLQNGDVVFVPTHGPRVRVTGEVLRPATYEVKQGETLDAVIQAAGGFTARAGRRRIQIERILPPERRTQAGHDRLVIDVTADQMVGGAETGIPVEAGDVVRVFAIANRVRNRVTIEGDVWTPGAVGFSPGMTVSQALRLAGGVKPDVYLGEILITRLQSDSTPMQLRASLRDSTGAVVNDLPLNEDDVLRVFSVTEFRPARYVVIGGAVRNSGRYPYREGMTLRDLVLLAGGVAEKAYLQEAEIARLPSDRAGGKLATTLRVPLDSTYLFERGPNGKYLGPPGLPSPPANAPQVVLRPYDNVLILEQPDWNLQRTVMLLGEVRFPGTYALTSKNERLSDLLKRAGGLTDQAYGDGVFFFRRRQRLGRIGIDLPRVLRDPNFRDNLILQDGDSIYLPQFSAVIDVRGAVSSPVAVAYVPGKDIEYYIGAAGGLNRKAEGGRAYVVQPNGKVESISRRLFLPDGRPKPRPGSVVIVPEKEAIEKHDYAALAGAAVQIAASLVAIVALIINSRRN
jgi:protein involved in polysaccharide export with SLBB domain